MSPTLLAIESSCDETSASVIQGGKVLNNIIATQSVHKNYGGVVPELASRAHQQNIVPVVSQAMESAGVKKRELDAVAYTQGPGLLGALLIGASFAKSMAYALDIPLIAVNHMQAHILAHFIEVPKPKFPFLCLTVSGGHTQIVRVKDFLDMEVIGSTLDDAVGEAFDKSAKLMHLPYPGGPLVDKYAQSGDPLKYNFPDSEVPGLDFSFSGIKTAFLYFLRNRIQQDSDFVESNINDICASLQHSLVQMLLSRLIKASEQLEINQIAIAGGVSANSGLRKALAGEAQKRKWHVYIPDFQYCTDNAGMIAMAAHYQYLEKQFAHLDISPDPRMKFGHA
ncbi:MAG: tRNA (adenosine(37)-N6)-threonylcarbamoyltransferase complex transferase subunit TsaD [Bacteroidota bacterium]